jgi:hypothetical protein
MHDLPACDLCSDPAIALIADVQEIPSEDGVTRRWKVHSRHARCAGHARPALRYMLDGTVETGGAP